MDDAVASRIQDELYEAVESGDPKRFQTSLKNHPDFPPADHWLVPIHAVAARAGLDMFKVLIDRYPVVKDWDLGHLGDVVGYAAMQGDIRYLKYLLEDLDLSAEESRIMYSPACNFIINLDPATFKQKSEVLRILREHGAK